MDSQSDSEENKASAQVTSQISGDEKVIFVNSKLTVNNYTDTGPEHLVPTPADWRITSEDRAKHDAQFFQLKPINGFVSGQNARQFFLQCNLPPAVLGQIWELADFNKDGRLDKLEFSIAMYLIKKKLEGRELPGTLPKSLMLQPSAVPAAMPTAMPGYGGTQFPVDGVEDESCLDGEPNTKSDPKDTTGVDTDPPNNDRSDHIYSTLPGDIPADSRVSRWRSEIDSLTTPGIKKLSVKCDQELFYSPESKIASGSDGTIVFVGMFRRKPHAIKRCVLYSVIEKNQHVAESLLGKSLTHVLIPEIIIKDDHFIYHVSKLCEWNLREVIEEAGNPFRFILNNRRRHMSIELLTGLKGLHDCGILHRDLKPSNVLIDGEGRVLVADFGVSRLLADKTSTVTEGVGCMCWMANEVLKATGTDVRYTFSADIQVVGYLLYYILTDGHIPHESTFPYKRDITAVIENIRRAKYSLEHLTDQTSRDLVEAMINPVPQLRPNITQCLSLIQGSITRMNNSPEKTTSSSTLPHRNLDRGQQPSAENPRLHPSVSEAPTSAESISMMSLQEDSGYQKSTFKGTVLEDEPWYHGALPRPPAEIMLRKEGDFLVRLKTHVSGGLVLSCRSGGKHRHVNIPQGDDGTYRFEGDWYHSVQELIYHHMDKVTPVTRSSNAIIGNPIHKARDVYYLRHKNITLGTKIAEGRFGDIHEATMKNKKVAVEICSSTVLSSEQCMLLSESDILKDFDHPNIVKLFGVAKDKYPIYVVKELVAGSDLLKFLRDGSKQLSKLDMIKLGKNAASGMAYLENKCCIHRALAARSCFIGAKNVLKIGNFEMSKMGEMYQAESVTVTETPIRWTAPEAIDNGQYTSLSDTWSYGILLWEIFTRGSTPYPGMTNAGAMRQVRLGYRMDKPETCPDHVWAWIEACWRMPSTDRPHFIDIKYAMKKLQRICK